eukprot:scaffold240434_cov28-Prasinocladus_malaysianus.AAC.1
MAQKPLVKNNKKALKPGKGVKKASGNKGKLYEKTKKGKEVTVPIAQWPCLARGPLAQIA